MEDEILEKFTHKVEKTRVQGFYDIALNILTQALNDLTNNAKSTLYNLNEESTRIFPMGDYTNDTFVDESGELEIVIASSNPQLIVENENFSKLYQDAKTKKQREKISNNGTFDKIIYDFTNILTKYFNNTTYLIVCSDGIKVLCLEEYGFKMLIRFATYSEYDSGVLLNFWDAIQKRSKPIDLFFYNENIEKKDKQTNGNYKKIVRLFKNLRKSILMKKWAMSSQLNKYFVELIIFNVPNDLLQGQDIVRVFYKVFNYLENCNLNNFVSFDGKKITSFSFAKISYSSINNFIYFIKKIL